jgi:hypothetical protein
LADVLGSTPERANAILYFDAPSVREFTKGTPLHDDLSEKLGEVRIAAGLDLKTLEPNWEIGYVTVANLPDANWLAKAVGGYADSIADKPVVWSPRNAYLVPNGNSVLGVVRPADRKLAGRWLKKETSGSAAYLQKQAAQGLKFISVLLAVDLEDVWSPWAIQQRIESMESLKGADLKSISSVMSSIKGLRVIASRKNLDECIISLDFGNSPASLLPVAKNFFVEVLERNHSSIPEASKWTASVDGNTLSFRGTISPATLDDMLGLFTLQQQASSLPTNKSTEELTASSDSAVIEASKAYFAKTSSIIKRVRDYSAGNTGERAQWNARMANRIDELPTLNVDPELIEFGANVSQGLRGNAVTLQQTNITSSTNAMINAGNAYGYNNNGYYNDGNSPLQYRAMARGVGFSAYKELISAIDQMEGDIRRRMTEKFKVQF